MGTAADVDLDDLRWLTPLPLWLGILAGPVAWALDLTMSYAVVKWVCAARTTYVLPTITIFAMAIVCAGAAVSWRAFKHTASDVPTDGGQPRQRARFMAILGLILAALFALQILTTTIPQVAIDACQ